MREIYARLLKIGVVLLALISCGLPGLSQPSASAPSSGSGPTSGGGAFVPATAIADVCSLLALSDIQTVLAGARAGVEQQTPPTSDLGFWSRDCKWDVSDTSVQSIELVIFGATSEQGLLGITAAAHGKSSSPETGLGTDANYWVQDADSGLWAINGSLSVDVTCYFLTQIASEGQLQPLVAKVLGEIK